MGLEALELIVGAEIGVAVIEADDESDSHLILFHMIDKRPPVGACVERPANRMHHQSGPMLGRIDLPKLFQTDAVSLGVDPLAQSETLEQCLGQRAAATLGEQRIACMKLDPGLIVRRLLTVTVDTHVSGGNTAHAALVVIQHLGGGKARVDLHAKRLCLLG